MSNFELSEFARSATADRLGIDNPIPREFLGNILLLIEFCELVRKELNDSPMFISSGYRCPALNKAVGGARNSYHQEGLACDFTAPMAGDPLNICYRLMRSELNFDQLIYESNGKAEWVHIGIAKKGEVPRREVLTISRGKTFRGIVQN